MKKIEKTVASKRTLLSDIRGANEFINTIILVVMVALAGIGAFQALGGSIDKGARDAATKVPGGGGGK
jgi:hypothetical protein